MLVWNEDLQYSLHAELLNATFDKQVEKIVNNVTVENIVPITYFTENVIN